MFRLDNLLLKEGKSLSVRMVQVKVRLQQCVVRCQELAVVLNLGQHKGRVVRFVVRVVQRELQVQKPDEESCVFFTYCDLCRHVEQVLTVGLHNASDRVDQTSGCSAQLF